MIIISVAIYQEVTGSASRGCAYGTATGQTQMPSNLKRRKLSVTFPLFSIKFEKRMNYGYIHFHTKSHFIPLHKIWEGVGGTVF